MEARAPGGTDTGTSRQRLKDRLFELGDEAYRESEGKFQPTSEEFQTLLLVDEDSTNLLWEYFAQYRPQAFSAFFAQLARRHHRRDGEPDDKKKQNKSKVRHGARGKATKEALLERFMIELADGTRQLLARSTQQQGMNWVARTRRQTGIDTTFVELLSQPMQATMIYGDYYRDNAEVERIYKLAVEDQTS